MQWQLNPYFQPILIAGVIGFLNVLFISRRLKVIGAWPLLGMGLAVSVWALAYAMELASRDLVMQVHWAKVQYFGIVSVSVAFFLFAQTYAQSQSFLKSKLLWLLWVFPLICVALVWTNEYHHLIWTEITQKNFGSYVMASFGHGIVFWLLIGYSYIMLLAGSVVLIRNAFTARPEFRGQAFLLILGVLINWAGNIIYISGANPIPDLDWTPLGFILSGIIYSVALFQFRLLDLVPIAGETVLESMDAIVIVLDEGSRIVYINSAFEYYTGVDAKQFFGRMATHTFAPWPGLKALADAQATVRGEVALNIDGREPFYFDTRVSTVRWKNQKLGRVFILDDISERRRAERNLLAMGYDASNFAATDSVPLIFSLYMPGENIIELNRSFVVNLGYERKDAVGRSLLSLGIWDAYQRAEFMRMLAREYSVDNYSIVFANRNGIKRSFIVSARRLNIESNGYIMVVAKPVGE